MRMWSFFGDGKTFSTPKLTHNALVRFAPEEKGPLSSIVNTSQGGGYASLLVVDNLKNQKSVSIREYLQKVKVDTKTFKLPNQLFSLPHFVGAQLIQIAKITDSLEFAINLASDKNASVLPSWIIELFFSIKTQTLEVVSYMTQKFWNQFQMPLSILKNELIQIRYLIIFIESKSNESNSLSY